MVSNRKPIPSHDFFVGIVVRLYAIGGTYVSQCACLQTLTGNQGPVEIEQETLHLLHHSRIAGGAHRFGVPLSEAAQARSWARSAPSLDRMVSGRVQSTTHQPALVARDLARRSRESCRSARSISGGPVFGRPACVGQCGYPNGSRFSPPANGLSKPADRLIRFHDIAQDDTCSARTWRSARVVHGDRAFPRQ